MIKYGFSIGHAVSDIKPGDWVHTHNMKTNLSGEEEYSYEPRIIQSLNLQKPAALWDISAPTAGPVSETKFG